MTSVRGCVYAGERRSRRARKNRQPIKASSTDTLAMLRLKVFEALSVHPQNQRLYVRGQLLEGELNTLFKVGVGVSLPCTDKGWSVCIGTLCPRAVDHRRACCFVGCHA